MNYLKKKQIDGGATILLSADYKKMKNQVLDEIKSFEESTIPCCVINYNELCDNDNGQIERTSDLNPFININIKDSFTEDYIAYIPDLISCLITIEYDRSLSAHEKEVIQAICSQLDLSKEDLPLFDIFKRIQEQLEFPDQLQRVYNKIDSTVETIKNKKDFYCEVSDPAILFYNFVYLILSIKNVYAGNRVWIYTDLLDHVSKHRDVMALIHKLLSIVDTDMFTINYMISREDPVIGLVNLNIRFVRRLDAPEAFNQYMKQLKVHHLRWKYVKTIAI
ncbi:hypothetical protein [Lacrimispora amygdalina]|uniref:hypothetical protein n=1 Tax=Lacrimispora amygdalina TaxID=253257 RepID=UPI000BE2EA3A|nr:hypothetical protein [Lacrimispora amygdalina]